MIYLRDTLAITASMEIDTPSGGITQGTVQQIGNVLGFALKTSTITSTDYEDYADTATMVTEARQGMLGCTSCDVQGSCTSQAICGSVHIARAAALPQITLGAVAAEGTVGERALTTAKNYTGHH